MTASALRAQRLRIASTIGRLGPPRRLVAGGVLIAAGIALVLVLVLTHTGGGAPATVGAPAPTLRPPPLPGHFTSRSVGASMRLAPGWRVVRRTPAVAVRSTDRSSVVTIASPAPAADWRGVLTDAVGALRKRLGHGPVGPGQGRRLAGRPARSAVVVGHGDRVLVAAVRGRRRAYLVEVLTNAQAAGSRLVEAQAMLGTLRLTR